MIKKLILLTFFSFNSALGCEVFFKKNIIINDLQSTHEWDGIKHSCSQEKIALISNHLRMFSGTLPTELIKSRLKSSNVTVHIPNKSVSINTISSIIKNSKYFKGHLTKKISLLKNIPNITSDTTKTHVDSTTFLIKFNNKSYSTNISYEIKKNILIAKNNITPARTNQFLNHVEVTKRWIHSSEIPKMISSKNEASKFLKFYKNTRFIKRDESIKKEMFRKKNILAFGQPVKVIFTNNNLRIKTVGLPQSSGGINDTVFVRLNNNKIISAEVIDKGIVRANL